VSDTNLLVEVDRLLDAPPEVVFRALTDANLYARWMGPDGSETVVDELDVRIGGRLAIRVRIPGHDMEFVIHGYYEEIEPAHRLVHSWIVEGDESVSTVVFSLEPVGGSTRLLISHHGLTSPEDVAQNQGGWNMQLDRLEQLLVQLT
jgi:uncharacterized protein YndB with AHSA1/START domain